MRAYLIPLLVMGMAGLLQGSGSGSGIPPGSRSGSGYQGSGSGSGSGYGSGSGMPSGSGSGSGYYGSGSGSGSGYQGSGSGSGSGYGSGSGMPSGSGSGSGYYGSGSGSGSGYQGSGSGSGSGYGSGSGMLSGSGSGSGYYGSRSGSGSGYQGSGSGSGSGYGSRSGMPSGSGSGSGYYGSGSGSGSGYQGSGSGSGSGYGSGSGMPSGSGSGSGFGSGSGRPSGSGSGSGYGSGSGSGSGRPSGSGSGSGYYGNWSEMPSGSGSGSGYGSGSGSGSGRPSGSGSGSGYGSGSGRPSGSGSGSGYGSGSGSGSGRPSGSGSGSGYGSGSGRPSGSGSGSGYGSGSGSGSGRPSGSGSGSGYGSGSGSGSGRPSGSGSGSGYGSGSGRPSGSGSGSGYGSGSGSGSGRPSGSGSGSGYGSGSGSGSGRPSGSGSGSGYGSGSGSGSWRPSGSGSGSGYGSGSGSGSGRPSGSGSGSGYGSGSGRPSGSGSGSGYGSGSGSGSGRPSGSGSGSGYGSGSGSGSGYGSGSGSGSGRPSGSGSGSGYGSGSGRPSGSGSGSGYGSGSGSGSGRPSGSGSGSGCPVPMCLVFCANGYEKDSNGCESCKCKANKDPCKNYLCASPDKTCVVKGNTIYQFPVCVQKTCDQLLPSSVQTALTNVTGSNPSAKPISLLQSLTTIIEKKCFEEVSGSFQAGTCTVTEFMQAVCSLKKYDVAKGFMRCLTDEAESCLALQKLLSEKPDCYSSDDIKSILSLFPKKCVAPTASLMLMTNADLKQHLRKSTRQERTKILNQIGTKLGGLYQMLPCDQKRTIAQYVNIEASLKAVSSGQNSEQEFLKMLPFIPYLNWKSCKKIQLNSTLISDNKPTFKALSFECDKPNAIQNTVEKEWKDKSQSLATISGTDILDVIQPGIMVGNNKKLTSAASTVSDVNFNHKVLEYLMKLTPKACSPALTCGTMIATTLNKVYEKEQVSLNLNEIKSKFGNLEKCVSTKVVSEIAKSDTGMCKYDTSCTDVQNTLQNRRKSSSQEASKLVKKCQQISYTDVAIKELRCVVDYMGKSQWKKMATTLCSVMNTDLNQIVKDYNWMFRAFLCDTCTNSSSIQSGCQNVKSDVTAAGEMNQKVKERTLQLEKMQNAVLGSTTNSMSSKPAGSIAKNLDTGNKVIEALSKTSECQITTPQKRKLWRKYKRTTSVIAENITEEYYNNLNKILAPAFSSEEIKTLAVRFPENSSVFTVAADCRNFTRKQCEAIKGLILAEGSSLTASDIEAAPTCSINRILASEIKSLSEESVIDAVMEKLNNDARDCHISAKKRERQAQAILEKKNIDLNDATTKITDTIFAHVLKDISNYTKVGNKVDNDFILDGGLAKMAPCPFTMHPDQASYWIKKLESTIDYTKLAELDGQAHGCWLLYMLGNNTSHNMELYNLIKSHIGEISSGFRDHCALIELKEMELSQSERESLMALKKKGRGVIGDAIEAVAASIAGKRKRRRRSVATYTCQMLKDMGSETVNRLGVSEINAMSNDEFLDCILTLGAYTGWTSSQLTALYQRSLSVLNAANACNLLATDIVDFGVIAYEIPSSELSCLPMTNDVAASLGQLPSWPGNKLQSIASRYLSHNSISSPASLSAVQLAYMGHALCGLSTSEIGQISHASYSTSAKVIGQLSSASSSCLGSLANLAKHSNVYGPVANWQSTEFSDIGILLGGLTSDELKSVSNDSIAGWANNGIQHISLENLKKLDPVHFEMLTRDQASQISTDNRSQLSISKQNALAKAMSGNDAVMITTTTAGPTSTLVVGDDAIHDGSNWSPAGASAVSLSFFAILGGIVAAWFL